VLFAHILGVGAIIIKKTIIMKNNKKLITAKERPYLYNSLLSVCFVLGVLSSVPYTLYRVTKLLKLVTNSSDDKIKILNIQIDIKKFKSKFNEVRDKILHQLNLGHERGKAIFKMGVASGMFALGMIAYIQNWIPALLIAMIPAAMTAFPPVILAALTIGIPVVIMFAAAYKYGSNQAKLKAIDENELHNSSSIQDENTLSRGLDPVISNKKAHTAENEKELTSTKSRTID